MHILVVEDEKKIAAILKRGLEEEHYRVHVAYDGNEALNKYKAHNYDCLVLDLMIPGIDGLKVCQSIRENNTTLPILILTAKDDTTDKIAGLDAGADDYVTKPFSLEEISARIRALMRRHEKITTPILQIADVVLDPIAKKVTRQGKTVNLTAREYMLLTYLLQNPNTILSKQQILQHVWDYNYEGVSNIVETYIRYLRKKLHISPAVKNLIHTHRGLGYSIKA